MIPVLAGMWPAIVVRVEDGDNLVCHVDLRTKAMLGVALWAHDLSIRLAGCNARELAEPGGVEARANLAALLPPGTTVTLTMPGPDKYGGRREAHVALTDGRDLVTVLTDAGWVARWNGRGPKPVPPWPRPAQL